MQNVHCHFISQIVRNKASSPDLYGRNFPTAGQMCKQDLWLPVNAQVIEATKRVRLRLRREVSNLPFQLCSEMDGWILPNNSHILKSHALDLNLGAALKTRALANKRMCFYLFSLPWTFFWFLKKSRWGVRWPEAWTWSASLCTSASGWLVETDTTPGITGFQSVICSPHRLWGLSGAEHGQHKVWWQRWPVWMERSERIHLHLPAHKASQPLY